MSKSLNVLKVESSARREGSVTRRLAERILSELTEGGVSITVATRDVAAGLPVVDEAWIGANFTEPAERTAEQNAHLALSDELVREVRDADVLVIGAPVYNFGIPASLKAWIDLVARARETFRYTDEGPVGLLEGKRAVILLASGGTALGSEVDFASGYLRQVLGFVGITDVTFVAADQLMLAGDARILEAERKADATAESLAAA